MNSNNKILITEFVNNEIIKVYRSINQPLKKKIIDLLFNPKFRLIEFLDSFVLDILNEKYSQTIADKKYDKYLELKYGFSKSEILNLFFKFPKLKKKFLNSIVRDFKNLSMFSYTDISVNQYPTYYYFENAEIIKNQWCVHFTKKNPYDIAKNGFKIGEPDYSELGLTTYTPEKFKTGGYNFGYTLDDYVKNAFWGERPKYGNNLVIFRASGVKAYHRGDREPQFIFWGNTAKNLIPIEKVGKEWIIKNLKINKIIYKNEDVRKVVEWAVNNYNQHKNVI